MATLPTDAHVAFELQSGAVKYVEHVVFWHWKMPGLAPPGVSTKTQAHGATQDACVLIDEQLMDMASE